MNRFGIAVTSLLLTTLPLVVAAAPCDGINHTLSDKRKSDFARAIAQQKGSKQVDVLDYLGSGKWSIVRANTYDSDVGFFFYSSSPPAGNFITVWGGAAEFDETDEIEQWAEQNAPGIPKKLAACFAWSVTKGSL